MKMPSILAAATIIFSVLLPIQALATTPERLGCTTMSKNTQCVYNVYSSQPNKATKLYLNTNMPYALCANAKCTIDKNNPNMSQCSCLLFGFNKEQDAWQQASVGPLAYDTAKPTMSDGQVTNVTSTYSSADLTSFSNKTSVECDFGTTTAWANCYGAKCTVDANGKTASCQCPVVRSKSFVSVGPEFKSDCQLPHGQIWSGATKLQDENNSSIMSDFYEKNFRENYKFR